MTVIRSAARQAPLYIRDATDIFVLLTVPDRMRGVAVPPAEAPLQTRARRTSPARTRKGSAAA